MPLKISLDLVGPAQDAAQIPQIGVAQRFQLLHGIGAAASGAAVHQPQGVFVRQHLGGAVDDLPQRQQLCPGDVPF